MDNQLQETSVVSASCPASFASLFNNSLSIFPGELPLSPYGLSGTDTNSCCSFECINQTWCHLPGHSHWLGVGAWPKLGQSESRRLSYKTFIGIISEEVIFFYRAWSCKSVRLGLQGLPPCVTPRTKPTKWKAEPSVIERV